MTEDWGKPEDEESGEPTRRELFVSLTGSIESEEAKLLTGGSDGTNEDQG